MDSPVLRRVLSVIYVILGLVAVAFGYSCLVQTNRSALDLVPGLQIALPLFIGLFLVDGAIDDMADLQGGIFSKVAPLVLPCAIFATGVIGAWRMAKLEPSLNNGVSTSTMTATALASAALAAAGVLLLYRHYARR